LVLSVASFLRVPLVSPSSHVIGGFEQWKFRFSSSGKNGCGG
jgi:hypothetical protein